MRRILKKFFPDALKIPVASTSAALKALKSEDEAAVAAFGLTRTDGAGQ